LTMTTGHQEEVNLRNANMPWTRAFLAHEVPHKPTSVTILPPPSCSRPSSKKSPGRPCWIT
jgi:hypothetical protein